MRKFLLLSSILIFAVVGLGAVSSFYIVDDTTGDKIPFGTGGELHFENISGVPGNITIFTGTGDSIDTTPYDNHLADDTIHFTQTEIDHDNLLNTGTYGHDELDAHVVDSTVHFLESSIDHTAIENVGTHTHAQLDSHVDDSTIHFTLGDIDHDNLNGASGYYNHSTIDVHIDDGSIHAPIYDNLSTSTGELWSSEYTQDYVDGSIPVGTIWMFSGNVAPDGWLLCNGALLYESEYAALFAVIGTTYGIGTEDRFKLPDFRGRAAIGLGQGDGLTSRSLGDEIGAETHTLTESELPSTSMFTGLYYDRMVPSAYYTSGTQSNNGLGDNTATRGTNAAHNNIQPSLVINYIIKY